MVIGNPIILSGGNISLSQSDENKVVSNGELVTQTSTTLTANGTYNTTLYSEVVVNIQTANGVSF